MLTFTSNSTRAVIINHQKCSMRIHNEQQCQAHLLCALTCTAWLFQRYRNVYRAYNPITVNGLQVNPPNHLTLIHSWDFFLLFFSLLFFFALVVCSTCFFILCRVFTMWCHAIQIIPKCSVCFFFVCLFVCLLYVQLFWVRYEIFTPFFIH